MKKLKNPKIGMVGLGYWGKNILRNLMSLEAVHTACDSTAKIIKERKLEFPDINYTNDFNDILNNPSIKGVVIATPAITHYNLVKQSLEAGKDVFVEKPLALNVKDGKHLVDIAKKKNRILMVGHILQYHSAIIKLKQLIKKGALGNIQYINSNRLNIGKLRVEENILWSFAPHDISVILELLESTPIKIGCFGEDYLNKQVHDVTLTTLEFKNKIKAHIFVSWLNPYKEQKLVVVGSKKMAVFDDMTKEKLFIYPHKIKWTSGNIPIAKKADCQAVKIPNKEPLKEEMKHFIVCMNTRKSPKTDGAEGLRVLSVLEEADMLIRSENVAKFDKEYFLHPSSCVDKGAEIGKGTKIWHFSHILGNSKTGASCIIGQNVSIGPDVIIGNRCKVQNNVSIYKGVILEDDVFCGPSCVFTNINTPRAFIERKKEFLPTRVKKGASIGANATIVCGATIGRYAFIGAGAVVKKDVFDHGLVVGVPAKQIGWVCECGVSLKFTKNKAKCKDCKKEYNLDKNKITKASKK